MIKTSPWQKLIRSKDSTAVVSNDAPSIQQVYGCHGWFDRTCTRGKYVWIFRLWIYLYGSNHFIEVEPWRPVDCTEASGSTDIWCCEDLWIVQRREDLKIVRRRLDLRTFDAVKTCGLYRGVWIYRHLIPWRPVDCTEASGSTDIWFREDLWTVQRREDLWIVQRRLDLRTFDAVKTCGLYRGVWIYGHLMPAAAYTGTGCMASCLNLSTF